MLSRFRISKSEMTGVGAAVEVEVDSRTVDCRPALLRRLLPTCKPAKICVGKNVFAAKFLFSNEFLFFDTSKAFWRFQQISEIRFLKKCRQPERTDGQTPPKFCNSRSLYSCALTISSPECYSLSQKSRENILPAPQAVRPGLGW